MRRYTGLDIATLLAENGFGELGENLFATKATPNKPDAIINVSVYGNFAEASANMTYRSPLFQVMVRDSLGKVVRCSETIYAIDDFLHGLQRQIVGDTRYAYILNNGEPMDINDDMNKRPLWVANYKCLLGGT